MIKKDKSHSEATQVGQRAILRMAVDEPYEIHSKQKSSDWICASARAITVCQDDYS